MTPETTLEETNTDIEIAVVHLVHTCQLTPDGKPIALPLVTMCGMVDDEPERATYQTSGCPLCHEANYCPSCKRIKRA